MAENKNKEAGKNIAKWFMMAIAGMIMGFGGGYMVGGMSSAMIGMFAAVLPLMGMMQMFIVAKNKNFLMLYAPLKEGQKYVHFPDKFGKMHTIIADSKHKGVLYKKGYGMIDDKGTEYSWGDDPVSWGIPLSGYTVSVQAAQYTGLLKKENQLDGYDNTIKKYLGPEKYEVFKQKFRKKTRPDIYDINSEIDFLLEAKPKDELQKLVFMETWDFKDYLNWLRYNYNPNRLDAAVETEKIWVKQEAMGYRDPQRAMNIAKGIAIVLFVIMIVIVALSSIDLSNFMNIFGG